MMQPIRAYLIYEYRILAELLEKTFGECTEVHLMGAARGFSQALEALVAAPAEILMIDVRVGRDEALEMVGDFHTRFADMKILPFGLTSEDRVLEFLETGASSYLLADATLAGVVSSLEALRRGESDLAPSVAASVCRRVAELSWEKKRRRTSLGAELTPREAEVLAQIAAGRCNKEIAKILTIKLPTVKNHVHKILEKLRVKSRREAVRQAVETGFLRSPLPLSAVQRSMP